MASVEGAGLTLLGVNVDPRLGFLAGDIAAYGAAWVRTVLLPPPDDQQAWFAELRGQGVKVLGVVARESIVRGSSYSRIAERYRRLYTGNIDALQVGNEPDHRSPSSWTQAPARLNHLIRTFRLGFPGVPLVGPGLASGTPQYLDAVDVGMLDAIAVHPYGQRARVNLPYAPDFEGFGTVTDLLDGYRRFGKPLWVTEFGGPAQDWPTEHERAVYHSEMIGALDRAGVEVACQFCWSDAMVPGFGLLDQDGIPKESYAAFVGGARALYRPEIERILGLSAGRFTALPLGIILHSTRSTHPQSESLEYQGTVAWVARGADGTLGWNVTIGPDRVAIHLDPGHWGWNAREHSREYLALEFAQARLGDPIGDRQVRAAAWWIEHEVLRRWPGLPHALVEHRELPAGKRDGKSDVGADQRIVERLKTSLGW